MNQTNKKLIKLLISLSLTFVEQTLTLNLEGLTSIVASCQSLVSGSLALGNHTHSIEAAGFAAALVSA